MAAESPASRKRKSPEEVDDSLAENDEDDALDSLEDLFGDFSEDDEHDAATCSDFQAALVRIDSEKEFAAQRSCVDVHKASSSLDGPTPSQSPRTPSDEDDEGEGDAGATDGSWIRWHRCEDGQRRVTLESASEAVGRLRADSGAKFPLKDVLRLLRAARLPTNHGGFAASSAVPHLSVPRPSDGSGRLVIVGDTHGQLDDVLWILFKHGEPRSTDNVYLFNGDVVDRGRHALEILLLMIMFSVADPGSVHFNRGNHEDMFLSSLYGYRDECREKYGRESGNFIFQLSQEVFNSLPLACVLDAGPSQRLFVVHGGLPRDGSCLTDISNLDFKREIPSPLKSIADTTFFDCMWADPQMEDGIGRNRRGPHVISFGPDVSKAFLKKSAVDLIIRSHAVPANGRGFEWVHDACVLTVFSASNYGGSSGNLGAVAVVRYGEAIETYEHWAGSRAELQRLERRVASASTKLRWQAMRICEDRMQRRKRAECLAKMQQCTLEHVKEEVVAHRAELFQFWTCRDHSVDFHVSPEVWRQGMIEFVGHEFPWQWIESALAVVDCESGLVPYRRFLLRFHVAQLPANQSSVLQGWHKAVARRVFESLLRADLRPSEALAALDRGAGGSIGTVELGAIAADCGIALSQTQCRALLRTLAVCGDDNRPGNIKLFHLLDSITVCFSGSYRHAASKGDEWVPRKIGRIARVLLANAAQPKQSCLEADHQQPGSQQSGGRAAAEVLLQWFRSADVDGNGFLSLDELVATLSKVSDKLEQQGVPADKDSLRAIARYMDFDGNGRVNYVELLATVVPCQYVSQDDDSSPLEKDLAEAVAATIYFNRSTLLSMLHERFDPDGTGRVRLSEFVDVLTAVSATVSTRRCSDSLLPREQIEALASELSGAQGEHVDYDAFIRSFCIQDCLDAT